MKAAVLVTLMTVGLSANASYYQVNCSSGEGTTRTASGHSENFVSVTERSWSDEGQLTEKVIRDNAGALRVEESQTQTLNESFQNHCVPNAEAGWGEWQKITAGKVTITKEDGSLFSENTVGVSADRKSVTAFMICEENGNSEIMCEK